MNDGLSKLGRHIAEQQDAELGQQEPNEASRRFLAEYAARRGLPEERGRAALSGPMLWLRLSLAAALIMSAFALQEAVFWSPALSYTVGADGESGVLRDWESAPDDAPLPIHFSDGTRIELEPRARARVVAIGRAGAELVIESGRAHLDVVPVRFRVPGESPWRVNLGPFAVEVKGTRFDVGWDPREDDFSLDLYEGSVVVRGCDGGRHTLVAGQAVRASCSDQRWQIVPVGTPATPSPEAGGARGELVQPPEPPPVPPETAAPPAAPPGAEPAAPAPRPRAARSRSWQELARDGRYGPAYERVLGVGFEAERERLPASDVLLLGDTARLNGDARRAGDAYSAVRRRFPGTPAAARAAFALGRLAVDTDPTSARRWFESYLEEQPHGPLAPAADDWLFELSARSSDVEQRRTAAQVYLNRHPHGAHAFDARRLLDAARP